MPNNSSQNKQDDAIKNARVFSMPPKYRHGAENKMVEPIIPQKSVVIPPVVPVVPVVPIVKKSLVKKKTSSLKMLLIAGGIVLVSLVIGGYILLRSVQNNQTVSKTPVTTSVLLTSPSSTSEETTESIETAQPTGEVASPFQKTVLPGMDTDSDGLTDVEEETIYGTDPRLPDTDGDGFLDGNEVFNRYDPNSIKPGSTLLNSKVVQVLDTDSFRVGYPSKWIISQTQNNGYLISVGSGEKISTELIAKTETQALSSWYVVAKQETAPTETKTKNGIPLIISRDQLTSYVDLGTFVLVIVYDTGTNGTINYLQTTKMMINTIELKNIPAVKTP